MTKWTGFSTTMIAVVCLAVVGCSDDGPVPPLAGSSGSTSSASADDNTSQPTTVPSPDSSGSVGPSDTTGTGSSTTTDPTGSMEGTTLDTETETDTGTTGTGTTDTGTTDTGTTDTGTTDTGTTEMGTSTGGSTSTGGNMGYEGTYDGTWEGMCPGIGMVNGTFTFDVDMAGLLTGQIMGFDSGPMNGTVDNMGVVMADVMAMLAGMCTFDGQIDMMGDVSGMWACPTFTCNGTWMGAIQP